MTEQKKNKLQETLIINTVRQSIQMVSICSYGATASLMERVRPSPSAYIDPGCVSWRGWVLVGYRSSTCVCRVCVCVCALELWQVQQT